MPEVEREVRIRSRFVTLGYVLLVGAILLVVAFGLKSSQLIAAGKNAMNAATARMSPPVSQNE